MRMRLPDLMLATCGIGVKVSINDFFVDNDDVTSP